MIEFSLNFESQSILFFKAYHVYFFRRLLLQSIHRVEIYSFGPWVIEKTGDLAPFVFPVPSKKAWVKYIKSQKSTYCLMIISSLTWSLISFSMTNYGKSERVIEKWTLATNTDARKRNPRMYKNGKENFKYFNCIYLFIKRWKENPSIIS